MLSNETRGGIRRTLGRWSALSCVAAAACFLAPDAAHGQNAGDRVRVPTSYANVHMGAGSGQQVLVLVPRGTVLSVIGRRGEWIQVKLSPELRKTGMVMRWYKNEDAGWMHDSTVQTVDPKS